MKKKKFGIDNTTTKAISQVMSMAENYRTNFTNTIIPTTEIVMDKDNPRKHKITVGDVLDGLNNEDSQYEEKNKELTGIRDLSGSIKRDGLMHPVLVYKAGHGYVLVAGERRFLATLLLRYKHIEARVYQVKPHALDLKIAQWVENDSRKNLNLFNQLSNVQSIIDEYERVNSPKPLRAINLAGILSVSRQQAQFFVGILSNKVLMKNIEDRKIKTQKLARSLINANTQEEIDDVLSLNNIVSNKTKPKKRPTDSTKNKVSFGGTKSISVAKLIIDTLVTKDGLESLQDRIAYNDINWENSKEVSRAFSKILLTLEDQ